MSERTLTPPTVSSVVSPEDGLFVWFAAEVLANAEALRGGADVGVIEMTLAKGEEASVEPGAVGAGGVVLPVGDAHTASPRVPSSSASVMCFSCGQTIDNEGEGT